MRDVPGTENIYRLPKNRYGVRKKVKGKQITFGSADNLDDAIYIRDWCKNKGWTEKYPNLANRLLFSEDYKLIEKITSERNVSKKTRETYIQTVNHYTRLLDESLTDLIKVYYDEEYNKHWKERRLKNDLIAYRNYLNNNYLKLTSGAYFKKMLTIFRHLEIQISYLPKISDKNVNDLPPITHRDLLTKNNLVDAYNIANPLMKAVILFESSSGCARRETLNLTVQDYLEANNINIIDKPVKILLLGVDSSFVPTFKVKRQKTNKYYFTYCTPQCNKEILEYLINRDNLTLGSRLFDCNLYYWNSYYNNINEELGLGKVRKYNKFRSHMLRKWNASTLYNNGMSINDVDSLQGRGKDSTHSSYFMEDPELLRQKYMDHMDCLVLEV